MTSVYVVTDTHDYVVGVYSAEKVTMDQLRDKYSSELYSINDHEVQGVV